MVGVIVAFHLARRGLSVARIGVVIGFGTASSALATVIVSLHADRWGRRRSLIALSCLSGLGYVAFGVAESFPVLVLVAVAGIVNGMGRDRGPASALEQAMLPGTTTDARRTWTMAWYNAAIDTGHALGALAALLPSVLVSAFQLTDDASHMWAFAACGIVLIGAALPYSYLGAEVEPSPPISGETGSTAADAASRHVVRRIAALFAVDSLGAGFLSSALIAYWFFERYGTSEAQLAGLFFAARILNVVSHLGAAWLARRVGLVNTMVFTHLPSSLLLMLAPAAPTAPVAAALFLAREALVEMDVPTRQSYVMAVVAPPARTYASGITNVTRNAGWAIGPIIGGSAMQHLTLAAPLFIGGALKIGYDVALYRSFRHIRPPEERM
jgi:predicted MFS family arabinose efflux permease